MADQIDVIPPLSELRAGDLFEVRIPGGLANELKPEAKHTLHNILRDYCETIIREARRAASDRGTLTNAAIEPMDIHRGYARVFNARELDSGFRFTILQVVQAILPLGLGLLLTHMYYTQYYGLLTIGGSVALALGIGLAATVQLWMSTVRR